MATNIDLNTTTYTTQRIASNLNIQDLTPQSKLSILVNGLENESAIFNNYKDSTLNNFYIQTASEEYVEYAGVAEGLTRFKEPLIRIYAQDATLSLRKRHGDAKTLTVEKGTAINIVEGYSWLVLNSDITLDGDEVVFLNCDIKTTQETTNVRFQEGIAYDVTFDSTVYSLEFHNTVAVPLMEESLETFRERLLYAKTTPRAGCESAILTVLSSSQLVTDYSTNFETDPYQLQIFSYSLFNDDTDLDVLQQVEIPFLETQLRHISSEGSSFEITIPKKVNFTLKLRPTTDNPKAVPYQFYSYKEYLQNKYKVGTVLEISLEGLTTFLENQKVDVSFLTDYQFVVFKNFLGNSYESKKTTLRINADEYPYIDEVVIE